MHLCQGAERATALSMRSSIHCLSSSPRRSNVPARPLPARPPAVAVAGGGAISGRYAPLALASPICSVCRLVLCGSVASHQHRLQNTVSHNAHALAMGSSQSRPLPSVPGAKRALPDPTSSGQGVTQINTFYRVTQFPVLLHTFQPLHANCLMNSIY
jgi:hypothetical protein